MSNQGTRWALAALLAIAAGTEVGCKPQAQEGGGPDDEVLGTSVASNTATCITIRRGVEGQVADTKVSSEQPNVNFGTANPIVTGSGPANRAELLEFTDTIPAGSVVTSATLTLTEGFNTGPSTIEIHRVTASWSESTVTWANFASAWNPAIETTFSNGGSGYTGAVSVDVTLLARGWFDGTIPNNGIALTASGNTSWWTSEQGTVTQRPALQICYAQATCNDGIQDQGERGVDCGGPCANECAHPPATEAVSGGDRAKSPHYTAVYTTGQPTQNQDKSTSPHYRVQGGLIGANGSLP